MTKVIRLAALPLAVLLALLPLSNVAQAATAPVTSAPVTSAPVTSAAAVFTPADPRAAARTSCGEWAEWPARVACDFHLDPPTAVITAHFFGKEIEKWTFTADGTGCVDALGHRLCLSVDFDRDEKCVTITITWDGATKWQRKFCWPAA